MLTITRRLEFDAGHRLQNHESLCSNAHGHRYVALITCRAPELDSVGRVIDFGKIKEIVGSWINENWDHGFIYEAGDPVGEWLSNEDRCTDVGDLMKTFEMATPPTAENMSKFLFRVASDFLAAYNIEVTNVRLYETPNCYADYSLAGA